MKKKEFLLVFLAIMGFLTLLNGQSPALEIAFESLRNQIRAGQLQTVLDSCEVYLVKINPETQPVELSDILTIKGTALRHLNQIEKAIEKHEQALFIRQSNLGNADERVANSHLNLGNCYLSTRNIEQAGFHFETARVIKEQLFPMDSKNLIGIYNSLGNYFNQINEAQQAHFYLNKMLKISAKNELNNPNNLIATHISLANFWYNQQFPDSSIYHLNAALIVQKGLTENVSQTALIYNNLGNALVQKGFYTDGKKALEQALDLYQQSAESYQNETGKTLFNLGNALLDEGDVRQALIFYKNALNTSSENVLQQAQINNSLGLAYRYLRQNSEARAAFRASINHYNKAKEAQFIDWELADVYANFGKCYLQESKPKPAIHYFEKAIELQQETGGNQVKIA